MLERTWTDKPGVIGFLKANGHKTIGLRFIVTALCFFGAAGVMGGLMRHQLATANSHLVGPDFYNQLFTMHGTTMMFLFAVPVMQGFALYIVPLMIGTRNTAFPRMTACAYWLYRLRRPPALRRIPLQHRPGRGLVRLRAARRARNMGSASAPTSGTC